MSESALLEPPSTGAPARPALVDLILLRLLPAPKSVAPKKLRDDLAVFFRRPPAAERVGEALAELRADGFVTPKGQQATAAGRARALQFLGAEKLPPKATWGTLKGRFLVPMALSLAPDSEAGAKAAGRETLAPLLLKRKLALPAETGDTLTAVVDALVCRELGYPDLVNVKDVIAAALGKVVGGEPITKEAAKAVAPRVLLGMKQKGGAGLQAVALGGWADGADPDVREAPKPADADEPFDLEMFANTVKSVARTCPTGRFGDNKVFISHVWNQLRDEPRFARLGLAGFKDKLVEANRENRLTLSGADLVQLMDPVDVRASETTYLTAAFHFILVEGN